MYLTNDLMNWADWLSDTCILRVMDIHWSYQNLLFWAGIVWHRLSANQNVRCFKLKKTWKLYEVSRWFFASIEAAKNIILFWVMPESTLGQSVCRIFSFDLFDLLILIPEVYCYIVLVKKRVCVNCCGIEAAVILSKYLTQEKYSRKRNLFESVYFYSWIADGNVIVFSCIFPYLFRKPNSTDQKKSCFVVQWHLVILVERFTIC